MMRIVPAGFSRNVAECGEFRLDLVQARADGAEQPLARFCRRNAAGIACQKPNAEPLLKTA